jgi:hypothetical protein
MLPNIRKVLAAGVVVLAAALIPMTAAAQNRTRTFTVVNYSHYRINHMYVSPSSYQNWGSDRLGSYVLLPNYRFDLSVVAGWYDVWLLDQDGDSCVVGNVDFRYAQSWTITDDVVVACELFTRN